MTIPAGKSPICVAHIVFRFDIGGLENGIVNIANALTNHHMQHVIIAMTESTTFRARLQNGSEVISLRKKPGKDPAAYLRLYRILRRIRPQIVHTRNVGTLDCQFVAFLAGVPVRIHGEHGWDVGDPDGSNAKFLRLRRMFAPLVSRFVAVSSDIHDWLVEVVGIAKDRVIHVCNGVDVEKFSPGIAFKTSDAPYWLRSKSHIVVGSVLRFSRIKDPLNLVEAFVSLQQADDEVSNRIRLLMVGDGELHGEALARLQQTGCDDKAWLPGSRDDIPALLDSLNIFVLGSLREGISNTILEAMATALPIIATDTGGNRELVVNGVTGVLVPVADPASLAQAIRAYISSPALIRQHGQAGRQRVVHNYSIESMVAGYKNLYREELSRKGIKLCAA